jgi:hypothetical protein
MKKLLILTSLCSLLLNYSLKAEKAPIKFGKISKEELALKVYEKDTSAAAVILCDFGVSNFIYSDNSGLQYQFKRNIRIKILKKEGYDWAKFEIYIRKKYDNLGRIKATSYNQESGKLLKEKLDNKQVFTIDYNKNWELVKFEMPAVKEGSILDIEYIIISDSYNIRDWYFQDEIPTLYSQYNVSIPEYFHYKQLEKGYIPIGNKTQNTRNVTVNGTDKQRTTQGNLTKSSYQNYSFNYIATDYTFVSKDVPAFYEEDYITSSENYISSIQYELGSVRWPNKPIKNYTNTWEAINKELLFDSDFGSRIKGAGFLKDQLTLIETLNNTPEAKIEAVYNLIRNKMHWDKRYSIYSFEQGKAWQDGNGTVGDINLLLVAALNRLGFDANPVLLSTRGHGFIHPAQIIVDQFNYVIASVKLGDKIILLDATEKNTPLGVLPERCLNGQGRLVDDKGGDWVDLTPSLSHKKLYKTEIIINPDLSLNGKVVEKNDEYAAIDKRNDLQYFSTGDEFLEDYQKSFTNFTMTLDSIENQKDYNNFISLNYHFETEPIVEQAGNLLMIDPVIFGKKTSNPFKLQERAYPVDYSYPHSVVYMATISIPEGYSVENLPENKRLILPNQDASFAYSVQNFNDQIVIVYKFNINKITFLPESYQNLKEFYNQVIDAQSKQIILKKI